ncbi:TPA: hypothetical protein DCZ39_07515 [Patescibacteria group bacterium]|nr:hypothetical protein [Candidatus Gracilibacteria bacterium]
MILQKMTEMNDIAHKQRETLINALGSGYNMQRDRLFQVTDNKYHTAQYRDDKFKAAGKLHALMMQQNTLHQQIDKENSEQIKKCDQLEKEIELLLTK